MSDKQVPPYLSILVLDAKDEVLPGAKITLRLGGQDGEELTIPFDKATGLYVARDIPKGTATVTVANRGAETQSRGTKIGGGENREVFILAEKGERTFFRGRVRVPVTADPDLIGLVLDRRFRDDAPDLDKLVESIGLENLEVPDLAAQAGMRLYRARGIDRAEALAEIAKNRAVEHVGIVVQMRKDGFSFLSREVVVQFEGSSIEDVREIAREYGFRLQRGLVYADGAFVLVWQDNPEELLDVIEKLAARDDVVWAEPSVVVSPELDAIIPGDTLWPGLWDRQLIGLADAWQNLQDAGLDTFGDPDILFAVWDSGTQTASGTPTNADFNGTLSNAQPKVLQSFDFENMVANNDTPWNPHGSGVAGVSVAMANNPNAFNAQGVVGSAPNVQVMLCAGRVPYVDIEVADQYIWMAGFDPQSPLTGFPASPPARGADVITCSLTPGAGSVLSGTAQAALDFVTTFGRGGKGTMCFFSTGNANANNVTARPYGAYEKCFAIAATSLANDGVTEIRAPYSGWGQIDFCTPSQDQSPTFHNPPTGYRPWSASHLGQGNLPSNITATTALSAAVAAGSTSITVNSTTGFAVNDIIHIGAFGVNGSEPARITAVNSGTDTLTIQGWQGFWTGGLVNAHAAADIVVTGPANHENDFGGTSSATPLAAGVAALVLSADPSLTYIEAREIMRNTAIKLDPGNTTANGQWLDINGNPSVTSGLPPVRSGWYGYGRLDAAAAVQGVITNMASRDLVIRDNLADTGTVATPGAFWNSPDIWCRTSDPTGDPAAFPASYAAAGPHQSPIRGQQNWICLRVRNNGSTASLDAWVRISVTHFPGMEFTYPDSWQPTNGPGDPLPSPMTPGTYFIGEAKVSGVLPGADETVVVPWPTGLIPPATVTTPSGTVSWHPCLLAEITPHDGPSPTGNHVWDDNNLAQKNISIVDTDSAPGTDFRAAMVMGSLTNEAECVMLEINRGRLPREVQLYVDLMDPRLLKRLLSGHTGEFGEGQRNLGKLLNVSDLLVLSQLREEVVATSDFGGGAVAIAGRLPDGLTLKRPAVRKDWRRGVYDGREVVFLAPKHRVCLPVCSGPGRLSPIVIGGIHRDDVEPGEYEIVLIQRQPDGTASGSATVMLRVGKKRG
jgi:subtilisin family serine protease